jgi:DNA replication protein DnaC
MKNSTDQTLQEYLVAQGVPEKYIKATDPKSYGIDYMKVYGALKEKSLFIHGKVGAGKTQMAVELLTDLAQDKKTTKTETVYAEAPTPGTNSIAVTNKETEIFDPLLFRFYNVPRFLLELRGLFSKNEDVDTYLSKLQKYQYIVLDDLGVEKPSDWVLETLYVIVNERYERNRHVIITSNKNLREIAETVGDRIASRLAEMTLQVKLLNDDRRLSAL